MEAMEGRRIFFFYGDRHRSGHRGPVFPKDKNHPPQTTKSEEKKNTHTHERFSIFYSVTAREFILFRLTSFSSSHVRAAAGLSLPVGQR